MKTMLKAMMAAALIALPFAAIAKDAKACCDKCTAEKCCPDCKDGKCCAKCKK